MTREQALKKLRRLLGPTCYAEIGDRISSPEKRDRYHARRRAARDEKTRAGEALDARRREVLAADSQYQTLLATFRAASDAEKDVRYHADESGYKFTVGTITHGMFRSQRAAGDTWEEVFAALARDGKGGDDGAR